MLKDSQLFQQYFFSQMMATKVVLSFAKPSNLANNDIHHDFIKVHDKNTRFLGKSQNPKSGSHCKQPAKHPLPLPRRTVGEMNKSRKICISNPHAKLRYAVKTSNVFLALNELIGLEHANIQ